ncbi:hypothetical protein GCM10022270_07920 [Terriglobus aquaticus]
MIKLDALFLERKNFVNNICSDPPATTVHKCLLHPERLATQILRSAAKAVGNRLGLLTFLLFHSGMLRVPESDTELDFSATDVTFPLHTLPLIASLRIWTTAP